MALVCVCVCRQMCVVYFKQREREAPGCRVDDRVLFIDEVEYETAATVDNVPCLLFRFQVQHVSAFYNAEGDCVAGHPDEIMRTFYEWYMSLDENLEDDTVEWKLAEFKVMGSIPQHI